MLNISDAIVWEPLEIELISEKEYDTPYIDVAIDAVFTHEDGTTIPVPGFWKKNNIFAIRFTPVKTGAWHYTVTANDNENPAFNVSGSFSAGANTAPSGIKRHGFITVKHNKKYFTYDDGTPFFWLGDTHWQAPNYEQIDACNYPGCTCNNQFRHEVDNRIKKGFTVYQTYFDTTEADGGGGKGKLPSLWDKKYSCPSDQFNVKIDKMFEYLNEVGLTVAVGLGVHYITTSGICLADMKRFARYIVARYGCYSIVWITAQEITRLRPCMDEGKTTFDFYMELADHVAALDGYKHPIGAHMDVMDITDERAQRLTYAPWQTCWIEQGGHGILMVPKKSHYKGYCEAIINNERPVIEGEMAYEEINCGHFSDNKAARVSGWNAYFNGCAGYSYGATGIWANAYSTEAYRGWLGETTSYSYDPWYMGLDKAGSFEMMHLKKFFTDIPCWHTLIPTYYDTSLASFAEDENKLSMRDKDNCYVICYFRNEDTSTGELYQLDASKPYKALWFNVVTGKYILIEENITGDTYKVPLKPSHQDWAFILTTDDEICYNTEEPYSVLDTDARFGTLIKPLSVTALGGMVYKNGGLYDSTRFLTDGDPETSWIPFSQRSMQTITFDLGTAFELSHIKLIPASDVLMPDFRIEVSLDNENWKILVDTDLEGATYAVGKAIERALNGRWRYVKLVLLTRKTLTDEEADAADYRLVENERYKAQLNTTIRYPFTEIKGIELYGNRSQ